MGKSVGLEIHARGVRAVEVTGRGKNAKVVRYVDTPLVPRGGAPDPEELQDALNAIFRGSKFSRNHVVTSLPADETVVREIPVPFKNDDQIRKVIKYEAEHHLHDCDADDVIVQYTRIGESADGANLLVFAARKDDISRRIEYARGSGVEPLAMDLDAAAVYNAVRASGALDQTPNCVLVNIQHRATEMIFVVDGEVRALRSVRMGVDSITAGLARDMDIDMAEADTKLLELTGDGSEGDLLVPEGDLSMKRETEKSHAELERDLFTNKRDDFLARLRREYVRSSAGLRGMGKPEAVIVTGPGLKVPGLTELLSKRLNMTVDVFQPSQDFAYKANGVSAAEFDAGAAVPLGLALKGLGNDNLALDFRQEEMQVANKFELLKNPLAVTVTLLFLALMASAFFFVQKKNGLSRNRFDELTLNAFQSFSTVADKFNALDEGIIAKREHVHAGEVEAAGERPLAIKRFVNSLRRMRLRLEREVGNEKGLPPITSALHMWNEIFGVFSNLHEEIGYIDFRHIIIKQDSVELAIIVQNTEAIDRIAEPLSNLDVLKGMKFDEDTRITGVPNTTRKQATLEWKRSKRR